MRGAVAVLLLALASTTGAPAPAAAAPIQRTFVASYGQDSNPCSRTAPCRTFAVALANTNPDGEVIVLDSAGYGAFTIGQGVTIVAPPGVYGGISVFSGSGITVNTTHNVTLRGLTLNGQGGTTGITLTQVGVLAVEDMTFRGLDGNGIVAWPATGKLVVDRSVFSDITPAVLGTGLVAGIDVSISRSSFLNVALGVLAYDGAVVTVVDSQFESNDAGIQASTATGEKAIVACSLCTFFDDQNGVVAKGPGSTVRVSASGAFGGHAPILSQTSAVAIVTDSHLVANTGALSHFTGGSIVSFGDNRIDPNTNPSSFTGNLSLQ